jgi:hypothetical protein
MAANTVEDLQRLGGQPEMQSVIDVMVRSTKRKARFLGTLTLALTLAACSTTSSPATTTTPVSDSGWVKDTVQVLNIFLPDGNSDYYLNGFGTKDGARTVISGEVPTARYWSYTAYPIPAGGPVAHVHDSNIVQSHGHYSVTLSASCAGIKGTCLATSNAEPSGMVVLRLYVPVDLSGSGNGGVPLPTITYESSTGSPISLTQAAGSETMQKTLDSYRNQHGALPQSLTRTYPPPAPVPVPVVDPSPRGRISSGTGQFNNPDNIYDHVRFTTTRGNLVVSAQAPTYQEDSFTPVNDLSRPASESPQVRYWSLCIVLKDLHTGGCLRDSEIHFPTGGNRFTLIVSPTCPVAGYLNCLVAGPEPLQVSLAWRYLLPSSTFLPLAFQGPYALTANYVGRPG